MLLSLCLFAGIGLITAQTQTVTGVVISEEDGQPVVGASVVVTGTSLGTVTDVNGKFSLYGVPNSAKTLRFSYIGMITQEVAIKTNLRIILHADTELLDEVVVTAMGISREKKALGYAVQDVKGEDLTRAANTNIANALQGKVAGIEIEPSSGMPGASSKITIRGSRSFTGDNTPLYVVDGMPIASTPDIDTSYSVTGTDYAGRSVDIDPNDIESINVLKGQAASALYGLRASNGVIIITTKTGKGIKKGKPEIAINSNLTFDIISVAPDLQKEFAQGDKGNFVPNTSFSWGPKISELVNDPVYGGHTDNKYTQQNGKHAGQYYVPQRNAAGLDPWVDSGIYDNVGDFFKTGIVWSNSINVAQGLDKGHYSFSLGNTTSGGIIPSTGFDRYNARLAAETQLNENFRTGFSGNLVTSKITKQSSANNGIMATVYPAPPSYDLAGIPSHVDGDKYTQNTYRGTTGFDGAYWAIENNKFTERSQRFFGNVFAAYRTNFNTESHKMDIKYQLGTDAYTTNYTDLWGYGHANGKGEIEHYGFTINEVNSLFTINYDRIINEDWNLNVLLGNEIVNQSRKYYSAYGKDFNYSGWNHIDNASVYQASESYRKSRTVGNFANLSLAYNNLLFISATGRDDIVSSMPRNNRSFFYPSVSVGFIFTELEPMQNSVLTHGKIRASYAEVGQAGTYYDSYYSTPVYGGGFSSGTPILYPIGSVVAYTPYSRVYDPNLKPQNTKSYELGADLVFFNGLFSVEYTFSRQNVKDQIFSVPLAGSTGSSELVTNGGSIHTNAHEITLGINPIKNKNFNWDLAFNFSKIDNFVDELAPGVNSIMLGGFVEPQVRAGISEKFPVIYGVGYLRNEAGQIVVDKNGLPQTGEEKVIGTVSPDFRVGFNTTLEFYKFRLSAVLDWKQGGQMYSGTCGLLNYYGISQLSSDMRKLDHFYFELPAVKVTGVDANNNPTYAPNDIKISGENAQSYFNALNNISESMIYDNSFIKLREIALSYPVWNKKGLAVTANIFMRNVLLWSELKGLDPEATQGNNNMAGAFERFSLPGTSSYGFGLNFKF
ncbi:TonB-dependent receptor SusC [termite gut metagenome]|uniref:TonB-dependent receptor SusC n=1 Tax=termite gut metagenome TaxID=433724 RepID=A0A5J4S1S6_9ZZZZ